MVRTRRYRPVLFPAALSLALALPGPAAFAEEAAAAPLPPLREGETVQSESFDIDRAGNLVYQRTIRRTVGYLGADVGPMDRDTAARLDAPPFVGVLVVGVYPKGPAALAGLAREDVILTYGEEPIRSVDQLAYLIEETVPETPVAIEVLRDGVRQRIITALEAQTGTPATRAVSRSLPVVDDRARSGLVLAEITPEAASLLSHLVPAGRGLLVADILPGGPAFFTAARRRDVLVDVGGRSTPTAAQYRSLVSSLPPSSRVRLGLTREGQPLVVEIKLARNATREREFHFPLKLVSYEKKPEKGQLNLLWGCLYNSYTSHSIHGTGPSEEHVTEGDLGLLFNLFRYRSREGFREVRFLWLFPFRFSSEG